jgi:hypothetical protein
MWSHPQRDNSDWSLHRPVQIVSHCCFFFISFLVLTLVNLALLSVQHRDITVPHR